jgi:hypothetical protein
MPDAAALTPGYDYLHRYRGAFVGLSPDAKCRNSSVSLCETAVDTLFRDKAIEML